MNPLNWETLEPILQQFCNLEMRQFTQSTLQQYGVDAITCSLAALRGTLPYHGDYLSEALASIGGVGFETLVAAIHDSDPSVRALAVETLGRLGDTRAVPILVPLLHDPDYKVALTAVEALGMLRDTRAVMPLITLLGAEEYEMREAVSRNLGSFGSVTVAPLINILTDTTYSAQVRANAAWVLGKGDATWLFGPPDSVAIIPPLLNALRYREPLVRANAARALGHTSAAQAHVPLRAALADADPEVRANVAIALAQFADPVAIPTLSAALCDKTLDELTRQYAAFSLGDIADPLCFAPLLIVLADQTDPVRHAALQGIGNALYRGVPAETKLYEPLLAALTDPSVLLHEIAAYALGLLGDKRAVDALICALDDDFAWEEAFFALGRLGDPHAIPELRAKSESGEAYIRSTAQKALAQLTAQQNDELG